jgi:uncharacterized membrane protein
LLAEAERAAAAPYLDYPPSPRWFPPAAGLWAAALVLVGSAFAEQPALAIAGLVALFAAESAYLRWHRHRSQTMPKVRGAPVEIRPALRRYFLGVAVLLVAGVVAYVLAGALVAAAAAFVSVTVGLALYERAYSRAAAAARRRLAEGR